MCPTDLIEWRERQVEMEKEKRDYFNKRIEELENNVEELSDLIKKVDVKVGRLCIQNALIEKTLYLMKEKEKKPKWWEL